MGLEVKYRIHNNNQEGIQAQSKHFYKHLINNKIQPYIYFYDQIRQNHKNNQLGNLHINLLILNQSSILKCKFLMDKLLDLLYHLSNNDPVDTQSELQYHLNYYNSIQVDI